MAEIMAKTQIMTIQLYGRLYKVPSISWSVAQPYIGIPMNVGGAICWTDNYL